MILRPFLIALQFLTRLPVRGAESSVPRDVGRSLLFYPLVGGLIGALLSGVALLSVGVPEGLRASLVLVVWVFVTGMLHMDGLADSADAWLGGHGDRERTLKIMKDPRTGTAGVVSVVLLLLFKYNALLALLAHTNITALILAPLLARAAIPLLLLTTPYVRPGGLGDMLSRHFPRTGAVAVILASGGLVIAILSLTGLIMLAVSAIMFILLRALMMRRIGGTTGDTAGAVVELIEAAAIAVPPFLSATP